MKRQSIYYLLFCLFVPLLNIVSITAQTTKDTIVITCYNDSLVTPTPDTNFIYVDNRVLPNADLTFDATTQTLKGNLFSDNSFGILVTPDDDSIRFEDAIVLPIPSAGLYILHATDVQNGCVGEVALFVPNSQLPSLIDPEGQWNLYQPYQFTPPVGHPFFNQKIEVTAIYFFDGDTLINDKVYGKIYQTAQSIVNRHSPNNQYVGALREGGQQVYWIPQRASAEILLYDYDLTVGDTMRVERFDIDFVENVQIILESIGFIQTLDQRTRRQFNFSIFTPEFDTIPRYFTSWIEGIGNIGEQGFLETHLDKLILTGFFDFVNGDDYTSFIQCFSKQDELVYQNPIFDNCYIDTASYMVEYTPLVVENATWILVDSQDDFTINEYTAYKIQGDTTINNTAYKKLFYYELEKTGATKFQILNQSTAGYLREDSNTRQVFIRFFENARGGCFMLNEDHVLLDFSKIVGEEFDDCHIKSKQIQESLTITQDTILELFGQYRRVLTNGGIRLIGGIGYEEGLFREPTGFITQAASSAIVNYCIGDNFSCNLLTNTTNLLPQKVDIFPNPTTTLLTLQLEQAIKGRIKLKSVAGQIVYTTDFSGVQHQIEVEDLPSGVYFLHLQAEEGYLVRKVSIQ